MSKKLVHAFESLIGGGRGGEKEKKKKIKIERRRRRRKRVGQIGFVNGDI